MSNKIYCGLTVMELYAKCIRVYYMDGLKNLFKFWGLLQTSPFPIYSGRATGTLIMMLIQSIVRLNQRIASTSISTSTFLGSVFTATAERAG